MAIPGMKPMHHCLLHGGMQPPFKGEDERRREGSGRPITSSNGYRLRVAGLGLDMDQCPGVLCSF
jgi:hypothetical protein